MTATPRKLLFLLQGSEGYGVMRVWDTLLRGLTAQGDEITVLLLEDNPLLRACWQGRNVEFVDLRLALPKLGAPGQFKALTLLRRGAVQLRIARRAAKLARDRGIGTIIFQSPLETVLASLIARLSGGRALWMMPNSVSSSYPLDLNRRVYRALFRHCNLIPLPNSHHTDRTLGPGAFRRQVVHLGIDVGTFSAARSWPLTRADCGLPEDRPVLGLFARLTEEKGALVLAEAMAIAGGDFHVLVCGGPADSPFVRRLNARIADLNLSERFHFLGHQGDIMPCYMLCDVILNARLTAEPFGLTVIEAMAMRRPVLAHGAGGPGETILDGETGWLIDAPTPEAFAQGLRRMMDDRGRWGEMGLAAEAHVRSNFSEERMIRDLNAVIAHG